MKRLDAEGSSELLREHLESARVYLAGSMPTEYELALSMASETLDDLPDEVRDPDLRSRIKAFLQHGLEQRAEPQASKTR